jgi:hypothetical protein
MKEAHEFWEEVTEKEHALIEARRAYASAYAKHFGVVRLGHDDRYAMPLEVGERRLRKVQEDK